MIDAGQHLKLVGSRQSPSPSKVWSINWRAGNSNDYHQHICLPTTLSVFVIVLNFSLKFSISCFRITGKYIFNTFTWCGKLVKLTLPIHLFFLNLYQPAAAYSVWSEIVRREGVEVEEPVRNTTSAFQHERIFYWLSEKSWLSGTRHADLCMAKCNQMSVWSTVTVIYAD